MKSFTAYIRELNIAICSSHWYPICKGNAKISQNFRSLFSFLFSCQNLYFFFLKNIYYVVRRRDHVLVKEKRNCSLLTVQFMGGLYAADCLIECLPIFQIKNCLQAFR